MDEYRKMLDQLFEQNSPTIISNSSTDHAIPLVAKLFQKARREAMIFTGAANPAIYATDEVVEAAGSLVVGQNGNLFIIVQKSAEAVSDASLLDEADCLIKKIKTRFGETATQNIHLYRADNSLQDLDYHFMVVDGEAFRFEPDNKKHEAFASFNNKEVGAKLKTMFDGMKQSSAELRL
ncbi:MAG: hypothetical protein ABL877_13550 [Thiobacillus sp.]